MTALGKLLRTTAFKLTLVYLTVFALFAAFLLVYFAWNTRRLITEQITTTVDAETGEISQIFARRGLHGLVFTIGNRSLRPGAALYGIEATSGGRLVVFAGGVLLRTADGAVAGGVGASAGTVDEDDQVALAGRTAYESSRT